MGEVADVDRGVDGVGGVEKAVESLKGSDSDPSHARLNKLLRIVKLSHHEVGSRARYLFDVPRAL